MTHLNGNEVPNTVNVGVFRESEEECENSRKDHSERQEVS